MSPLRMLVHAILCAQAQLIKKVLRAAGPTLLKHFYRDVVADSGQPGATCRGRREPHVAVGPVHCTTGVRAAEDDTAGIADHAEMLPHVGSVAGSDANVDGRAIGRIATESAAIPDEPA